MSSPGMNFGAFLPCSALFLASAFGFIHGEYLEAVFLLLLGLLFIPVTR